MESISFSAPLEVEWRVAEEPAPYGVVRPTVYLDTTIPSYLTDRLHHRREIARCQRLTWVWWDRYRNRFDVHISAKVTKEAGRGREPFVTRRLGYLQDIPELAASAQTERLAASLISHGILPLKASSDAVHIAIAAAHSIQYLLTWNCKHLANPFIARHVVRMCALEGLRCPKICTPEVLMRTCRHERSYR